MAVVARRSRYVIGFAEGVTNDPGPFTAAFFVGVMAALEHAAFTLRGERRLPRTLTLGEAAEVLSRFKRSLTVGDGAAGGRGGAGVPW